MRASRLPILWFTAAAIFVGGVGGVGCGSSPTPGTGGAGGRGGNGDTSTVTSAVSSTSTGAGGAGGGFTTTTGVGGSGGATASSSASGAGGATSSSSASGTGGSGGATSVCMMPSDCPPPAGECVKTTCVAGACGTTNVVAGTPTMMQTPGDCLKNVCDGNGAISSANDDTDVNDDSNPCTADGCSGGGVATHVPVATGTACGVGQVCNAAGSCVGCVTAATCAGVDDECKTRTCIANVCGFSFTAAGTPTAAQTAADCKKNQCDGAGAIVPVADNTDLPVDNLQCTSDVCAAGAPSNPPTQSGSACNQNGGTTCNGGGQCVQCVTASTCPGMDTQCQTRTCKAGACGFSFTASGTPTSAQTAGDCKQNECNGSGAIVANTHNADVPVDGNLCTSDVCTQGIPSNPPVQAGSSCGAGLVCNAMGTCLGCNTGADCPGSDTECQTRTCTSNTCGVSFTAAGTPTAAQTPGDCKQNECNGAGAIVANTHNADVPNDTFQCTTDTCVQGVPTFTPVASGAACNQNNGTRCDAIGDCVQCNTASDCPGSDTDCHIRTCTAGACGVFNTAAGNPTTTQTTGNCQSNQCDGAGNAVNVADNTDVPVDSKQCTSDVCAAGVPSNPNLAAGTACSQNGGTTCNGSGACVAAGGGCADGTQNGNETAIDCGGGTCGACASGKACLVNSDCLSNSCAGSVCVDVLVLSQLQTRGSAGGNDEFVEIYNPTSVAVTFDSTWKVEARSASGTLAACANAAVATRFVGGGQVIQPHHHLLYTNSTGYDGATVGDGTYTTGITDGSSVVLRHNSVQVDAVCFYFDATSTSLLTSCPTAYVCEGTPVSNAPHTNGSSATSNADASIERLPGGALGNTQDTNINSADFASSNPDTARNLASAPTP